MLQSKRIENSASEANLICSDIKQIYQARILYSRNTSLWLSSSLVGRSMGRYLPSTAWAHIHHIIEWTSSMPSIRGFLCIPVITVWALFVLRLVQPFADSSALEPISRRPMSVHYFGRLSAFVGNGAVMNYFAINPYRRLRIIGDAELCISFVPFVPFFLSCLITLRASCCAVYCNRSCLFVGGWVCVFVGLLPR